jgi:hypothetical protein
MSSLLNDIGVDVVFSMTDTEGSIDVSKVQTPNGNRVELSPRNGEYRLRLDPLAFESLAWQPGPFFDALAGEGTRTEIAERARDAGHVGGDAFDRHVDPQERSDDDLKIGNEFTTVYLQATSESGRERLEIRSPKMGYGTWLSVAELHGIARLDPSLFSELLRTPLGPEEDEH